jgi:hypothetical protein
MTAWSRLPAVASILERLRSWLNRPTLEEAELEQGMTPAERADAELDYESKKDDETVLHGAVEEDVLHFDDDSKAPG